MNRVLLRFLWRRHRAATLIIGLAPILIGLIMGFIYPTYSRERENLKMLAQALKFFGQDKLDMFSPEGSFSITFQDPLILFCYALLPALAPLALFAGDRGRGALDLMLATPLDRGEMARTVALFQVLQALWFSALALLGAFLATLVAGEVGQVPIGRFLPLAVVAFGVTCSFGGLASLVAVGSANRGQANLRLGVIVFVMMAIDVVARMWRAGAFLGWLTPLGYLRPANLLTSGTSALTIAIYYLVPLVMALLLWSLALYQHRRRAA